MDVHDQLMMCALVLVIREREELIEGHNDVTTVYSYFLLHQLVGVVIFPFML